MSLIEFLEKVAARGFWFNIGHIFVILTTLSMGILAYKRNPRNLNNRSFLFLNLSFSIWAMDMYFSDLYFITHAYLLLFSRLSFALGFLICIFYLNFCVVFPDQNTSRPWYYWAGVILGLIFAFIAVTTNWMIKDFVVDKSNTYNFISHDGPYFGYAVLAYALLAFGGTAILFSKVKKLKGKQRTQVWYVVTGAFLFIIYIFSTDLIPQWLYYTDLSRYGALGVLSFVGFTSYAIIKHRLMDIKAVLLKSIAHLSIVTAIGFLFVFFVYYLKIFYQRIVNPDIVFVIASFAAVFGFQPLRKLVDKSTDNFFFRTSYDFNKLLSKVSNILSHNIIANQMVSDLVDTLKNNLLASKCIFSLSDGSLIVNKGFLKKINHPVLCNLVKDKKSLTSDEIEDDIELNALKSMDIEVLVKIPDGEQCFGLLALGEKKSGEAYSIRDLNLLEIIAPQITIAIKNAKRQEEMIEKVVAERQRINQDAHDKIYNRLGALAKMADIASDESKDKELLEKIGDDLRHTVTDLKTIVDGKESKSNGSLEKAINKICNAHSQNYKQKVDCKVEDIEKLNIVNGKFFWNIECIIQECLNNAGKHSRANNINVRLTSKNGSLVLIVKDDGKGLGNIDINNPPEGHNGLKSITSRVKSLKGKVDFKSSSKGTEVTAKIPL